MNRIALMGVFSAVYFRTLRETATIYRCATFNDHACGSLASLGTHLIRRKRIQRVCRSGLVLRLLLNSARGARHKVLSRGHG
jgi:hypothetical protein